MEKTEEKIPHSCSENNKRLTYMTNKANPGVKWTLKTWETILKSHKLENQN